MTHAEGERMKRINRYICCMGNGNSHTAMGHTPRLGVYIHCTVWVVLFCLPFFFTGRNSQPVTWESYTRFVIVPCSFMLVFYANYLFLIGRYLFTRRLGAFLLANAVLIALMVYGVHVIMQMLPPPHDLRPHGERSTMDIIRFFSVNTLMYVLVAGISVAIRMTGVWYRAEAAQRDLEKTRAETELQNLKSQLNPHFLFNTLNNIYSLIAYSPEVAQGAVYDLSRLLRYVLYESSEPFVSLGREVDFIRDYVGLMRIRLPEHVRLDLETRMENVETPIAPLLFISLVENAFKHGVSHSEPSFISIAIRQCGEEVACSIRNSCFPKSDTQDKSGSGIGLANLQKRLELIYPGRFTFRTERVGMCFEAELTVKVLQS